MIILRMYTSKRSRRPLIQNQASLTSEEVSKLLVEIAESRKIHYGSCNGLKSKNFCVTELTMTAVMQDLFLAGAETTSTTLTWACLYLSLYPDKQEKLHKEIDRDLGGKLPSLADRPRYIINMLPHDNYK